MKQFTVCLFLIALVFTINGSAQSKNKKSTQKKTQTVSSSGVIEGEVIARQEYMIGFGITVESTGTMYDVPIETRYGSVKKRSGNIDTVGNWVRVRYSRKTPTKTGDFDLEATEIIQINKPVSPILQPREDQNTITRNASKVS